MEPNDDEEPCDYCGGKGFLENDPYKTCPACGGSGLDKDCKYETDAQFLLRYGTDQPGSTDPQRMRPWKWAGIYQDDQPPLDPKLRREYERWSREMGKRAPK